jgi:hypothetical protein
MHTRDVLLASREIRGTLPGALPRPSFLSASGDLWGPAF